MASDSFYNILFALPCWAFLILGFRRCLDQYRAGVSPISIFSSFMISLFIFLICQAEAWQIAAILGIDEIVTGYMSFAVVWFVTLKQHDSNEPIGNITHNNKIYEWLTLTILILSINLPLFWWIAFMDISGLPSHFIEPDQAYYFMTTLGLLIDKVPPDLSFAGNPVRYHYGYSLLAALITKNVFTTPNIAHFFIGPFIVRCVILSGFMMLCRQHKMKFVLSSLLVSTIAFIFFVDSRIISVLQLIVDIFRGHQAGFIHALGVLFRSQLFMRLPFEGHLEAQIAIIIVIAYLINYARQWEACVLIGFLFFVKPQAGLAVGAAYALLASWQLVAQRRWHPFIAGSLGLIIVAINAPFLAPPGKWMSLGIGIGETITRWKELAFIERIEIFANYYLFAFPFACILIALHKKNSLKFRDIVDSSWIIVAFAINCCLIATFLVFRSDPALDIVFADLFERGKQTAGEYYTFELGLNTLKVVLVLVPLAFSIMLYRIFPNLNKIAKCIIIVLVCANCVFFSLSFFRGPQTFPRAVDGQEVASILKPINTHDIVLTNDHYLVIKHKLRPYINFLYPAVSGKQFYSSNIKYGNWFTEEGQKRWRELRWFFGSDIDQGHALYLKNNNIKYLLISTKLQNSIAGNESLLNIELIARSKSFRLYRVE